MPILDFGKGDAIQIVTGAAQEASIILERRFDPLGLYIFSADNKEIDESKQDPLFLISHLSIV